MTIFYQETSRNLTVPISRDLSNATIQMHNEKIEPKEVCADMDYPFSTETEKFVYPAKHSLTKITDPNIKDEANEVILEIETALNNLSCAGADIHRLPPLRPSIYEDGSIVFEIIFIDFRVGFSIEHDRKDSGWYIVSRKNLGNMNGDGNFANIDLRRFMITWLLSFVIANS